MSARAAHPEDRPETSAAPAGAPPREPSAGGGTSASATRIEWSESEPDARARARKYRLPMIIYLRAEWSVASIEAERTLWRDADLVQEARRFVAVRLDVTAAERDEDAYVERYRVHAIPSVVILDSAGKTAAVVDPPLEARRLLSALHGIE